MTVTRMRTSVCYATGARTPATLATFWGGESGSMSGPVNASASSDADYERSTRQQLGAISVLFAQVAMAAARLQQTRGLAAWDEAVLRDIQVELHSWSRWLRVVQNPTEQISLPSLLATGHTDLVLLPKPLRDPVKIADYYDQLAARAKAILDRDMSSASESYEIFQSIAEKARTEGASKGEEVVPTWGG